MVHYILLVVFPNHKVYFNDPVHSRIPYLPFSILLCFYKGNADLQNNTIVHVTDEGRRGYILSDL